MKTKLFSLAFGFIFLTIACGGSSGGGSSIFNFFGIWFAGLTRTIDSCQLNTPNSGDVIFNITQTGNVVTVKIGDKDLFRFEGLATENSFSAVAADKSPFLCADDTEMQNITATLDFNDASGDTADAVVSIFGGCPGEVEQCQLTYAGSALRMSGPSSASGDIGDIEIVITSPTNSLF